MIQTTSGGYKKRLKANQVATPAIWRNFVSGGKYHIPDHVLHIDRIITDAIAGRIPERLIVIEAPPRHGKTEYFSKTLPPWFLGRYPEKRVILTSYNSALARDAGRKARDIYAEYAPQSFGTTLSTTVFGAAEWENNRGGGLIASGIGGTITGKGADLFVIDDFLKNSEDALSETIREKQWEWFSSTAITRVEPGGIIVVMATRWHEDDLIGRILTKAADDPLFPDVYHCRLPAICEEPENDPLGRVLGEPLWEARFDAEALEMKKNLMLPYWWLSMYQQRPTKHGDTEWSPSYFEDHIWIEDFPDDFELEAVAIDPSKGKDVKKGDYSAILRGGMKGGKLYVTGIVRRLPVEEIVDQMIDMNLEHPEIETFGLESNSWQDLIQNVCDAQCKAIDVPLLDITMINNMVNKERRISRLGPHLKAHAIVFENTPDMRRLVNQLQEFPLAQHDDGPDALEMLIRLILKLCGLVDSMTIQESEDIQQLG